MQKFLLTDEGLAKMVARAERSTIISVFVIGTFIIFFLFLTFGFLGWLFLIFTIFLAWGVVEALSFYLRRRIVREWIDYKIEYEHSQIIEIKQGEEVAKIRRNDIQEIYTSAKKLIVRDLNQRMAIPFEIEGFDELVDELRGWRTFGKNIEIKNQSQKTSNQLRSKPTVKIGGIRVSGNLEPRRLTYQETRMQQVRQARRHKWMRSKFDISKKRRR